jgi:hypothetical protein
MGGMNWAKAPAPFSCSPEKEENLFYSEPFDVPSSLSSPTTPACHLRAWNLIHFLTGKRENNFSQLAGGQRASIQPVMLRCIKKTRLFRLFLLSLFLAAHHSCVVPRGAEWEFHWLTLHRAFLSMLLFAC